MVRERHFVQQVFFGTSPGIDSHLRQMLQLPDESDSAFLLIQAVPQSRVQPATPDQADLHAFECSTDILVKLYQEIQGELYLRGKLPN